MAAHSNSPSPATSAAGHPRGKRLRFVIPTGGRDLVGCAGAKSIVNRLPFDSVENSPKSSLATDLKPARVADRPAKAQNQDFTPAVSNGQDPD